MRVGFMPKENMKVNVKFDFENGLTVSVLTDRTAMVYPTAMTENSINNDYLEGVFEFSTDLEIVEFAAKIGQRPRTKFKG